MTLKTLEERLFYTFKDISLLEHALTHSSYVNEHDLPREACNERLEFLGDAVLETLVSRFLFTHFPEDSEGDLSRKRATLVCEEGLAGSARELLLGDFLMLGKGAEKEGARAKDSVLSDAFEAVLAALFLDGGEVPAKAVVDRHVLNNIEHKLIYNDAKTTLQEYAQRSGRVLVYELLSAEGPDHMKVFTSACLLDGIRISSGTGHSKKASEQEAAKTAIKLLRSEGQCI